MENKKMIKIEYSVKDAKTGEVLDQNVGGEPLEFLLGASQVIAGLEKALSDAKEGDQKQLKIEPDEAYGEYHIKYLQEVPREQFEGIELREGMTLFGHGENGQSVQVSVKSFNDDMVIIDYNHPLAGKTLLFDVKVLGVREASEEDLMVLGGGCCGGGGHSHGGGGCCGGGGGGCGCSH
ncbi:peptidylprolyl isomerase [Helicobacter enhydrae]|uniref:Peptidyl-prolyl cis-trans isomerase n=1 Tax=Helicobacter enhydrae TaxID=222136 RepID=A0A1B1U707_9HELI|nr:peptidylprolyl isomerase [Helicobacter enhydrae]ANV98465.1 peptidylprolyl isomerase [Helicobacter enhydrae]